MKFDPERNVPERCEKSTREDEKCKCVTRRAPLLRVQPAFSPSSFARRLVCSSMEPPRVHNLAPGELFEVPIDIKAPSILQFSFSTSEGGSVEFSVVHQAGSKKAKETTLLPASTYTENIGEVLPACLPPCTHGTAPPPSPKKHRCRASCVQVLLPGQGVCVVRFHNPTGWFYSSQVKVRYSLTAGPTQPAAPDAVRPKKPPPPPPKPPPVPPAVAATLLAAAEAPSSSAAEEPAAAMPIPKELPPEMGATLSRQLARRPSLDEVTFARAARPYPYP